jgi:hypothetical protein
MSRRERVPHSHHQRSRSRQACVANGPCGPTAGKALFGSGYRVGASRGRLLDWPDHLSAAHPPDWVLPTTYPSAVLRSRTRNEDLLALVADLRVAAAAL